MSVGDICNREVVIVNRNEHILATAKLMRNHHVGDVVVVEETAAGRKPVGIVTDRDIVVEVIAKEVGFDTVTAGDIMSIGLVTAREEDSLWDAIRLMRGKGIRRLPVVDAAGILQGIVTVDDLLDLLAEEMVNLSRVASRERGRETEERT